MVCVWVGVGEWAERERWVDRGSTKAPGWSAAVLWNRVVPDVGSRSPAWVSRPLWIKA